MIRRTLRDLPAIKWRDEKIEEWRELARERKDALRAAEKRAEDAERRLRQAGGGSPPDRCGLGQGRGAGRRRRRDRLPGDDAARRLGGVVHAADEGRRVRPQRRRPGG
ncbi:hypothetical protein [Kytococcus sp. Marseille-QA3725]